jgi:hypothetical protein
MNIKKVVDTGGLTMTKMIHVTVALYLDEDADVSEVIAEMDYDFTYEDQIKNMELIDVNTEV